MKNIVYFFILILLGFMIYVSTIELSTATETCLEEQEVIKRLKKVEYNDLNSIGSLYVHYRFCKGDVNMTLFFLQKLVDNNVTNSRNNLKKYKEYHDNK